MKLIKNGKKIELIHADAHWPLIKEEGFSPVQMVVAAASACSGYVFVKLLTKKRIKVNSLMMDVDYKQNLDEAVHVIEEITIHFFLDIAEADQEKAQSALKYVKKACPVVMSLHPDIKIVEKLTFESHD
ncbi:OsmC family protein [Listeria sp. PSOL-1]|uniref:OsmC family protein n=1 Tax=Listeria sp. PSOL-1 TaxID=1844999 RepID=UPI0013D744D6|nr:OsmC family protein [Listeria sp. PSOL-1]